MALFKNTNISFESKNGDTVIGSEAYFQGTLTAKGSLRIDGRVDGSIVDAKIVTVGKSGKVKGDISCEICYVSGEVKGNITALDHIEVLAGSHLDGDMRSPRIMLEEGAHFNGNCSMDVNTAKSAERQQPQQQAKTNKTEAKQQ
ncbi:MAG: polymer-forming cytoskeletal protein [Elusimicrobiales bacterium]|nr:polymer-forming cytoskeletal protein [Elusimicrobiales bacterium]